MKTLFYIACISLLFSCGSFRQIEIETFNPSSVTYPSSVKKILVVNNAAPQPSDVGYRYILFGRKQDTARAVVDSALFNMSKNLGLEIAKTSFFEDVLLYNEPIQDDDLYFSDKTLAPEQVVDLCDETGTDAIISIDRLLFDMTRDDIAFSEGYISGSIDIRISGVVRSYLPGRTNPLATILVTDSIQFSQFAGNLGQLNELLPDATTALAMAGNEIGERIAPNFVPHWTPETRWFYTGVTASWKQASAYASLKKWDQASEYWQKIFAGSSKWKEKAKAASNIAFSYEMRNQFDEAYEWSRKSYDLFKEHKDKYNKETQLQKLYVETLAGRVQAEKILKEQIKKE